MGTVKCSPKFYCSGQFKAFQSVIQVFSCSVQETWLSCLLSFSTEAIIKKNELPFAVLAVEK